MYISHEDLKQKIIAMERKYDKQFQIVFKTIKQLEPVSKIADHAQGQGASRRKSAAYMWVCEHFKEVCNAAIGY